MYINIYKYFFLVFLDYIERLSKFRQNISIIINVNYYYNNVIFSFNLHFAYYILIIVF